MDGHFVESYYPTIENTFSKNIKYKGQEYTTEIIDTAGQVRIELLSDPTPSHANPCILKIILSNIWGRMNTVYLTQSILLEYTDTCLYTQ